MREAQEHCTQKFETFLVGTKKDLVVSELKNWQPLQVLVHSRDCTDHTIVMLPRYFYLTFLQSDWSSNEMEKKADEFADKYGAEYWYTSSRTGECVS